MLIDLACQIRFERAKRVQILELVHFGVRHGAASWLNAERKRPNPVLIHVLTVPSG